jgi:hypothetical protein
VRDIITGGMGKMLSVADAFPRLADRYMERTTFESQLTNKAMGDRASNLYEPVADDGGERGKNWAGRTKGTSLYTRIALHPEAAAVVAAVGVGLVAALALGGRVASPAVSDADGGDHGNSGGALAPDLDQPALRAGEPPAPVSSSEGPARGA